MSGIEQPLVTELVAAVNGKRLPSSVWRGHWQSASADQLNAHSANQPFVALATAYLQGEPGSAAEIRAVLAVHRQAWMGDECNSTVYGLMFLLAVGGIATHAEGRDPDIRAEALSWLAFWHGLAEACRDPRSGVMLTVGDRSGDKDPAGDQTWRGWVRALSAGEPLAPWEAQARSLGLGMGQSWQRAGLLAAQGALAAAWPLRSVDGWGLLDPIHILTWPDGSRAIFMPQSHNGNTPALLAAASLYDRGEPPATLYLPPGGGSRIRSGGDGARCWREGDRLIYTTALAGLAPPDGRAEIALPVGEPAETIIGAAAGTASAVGSGGTGGSASPPSSPPPVPPKPGRSPGLDFDALAATVAALGVPRRQRGLRDALAAELRDSGRQRPSAVIAGDLEQLSIGDDQAQAAAWRAVIASLRSA